MQWPFQGRLQWLDFALMMLGEVGLLVPPPLSILLGLCLASSLSPGSKQDVTPALGAGVGAGSQLQPLYSDKPWALPSCVPSHTPGSSNLYCIVPVSLVLSGSERLVEDYR